jgi:tubby-related protein 1
VTVRKSVTSSASNRRLSANNSSFNANSLSTSSSFGDSLRNAQANNNNNTQSQPAFSRPSNPNSRSFRTTNKQTESNRQTSYDINDVDINDYENEDNDGAGSNYKSSKDLWKPSANSQTEASSNSRYANDRNNSKSSSSRQEPSRRSQEEDEDEDYGTTFKSRGSRTPIEGAPIPSRASQERQQQGDAWSRSPTKRVSYRNDEEERDNDYRGSSSGNNNSGSWSAAKYAEGSRPNTQSTSSPTTHASSRPYNNADSRSENSNAKNFSNTNSTTSNQQQYTDDAVFKDEAKLVQQTLNARSRDSRDGRMPRTRSDSNDNNDDNQSEYEEEGGVQDPRANQAYSSGGGGMHHGHAGAGSLPAAGQWSQISMEAAYGLDDDGNDNNDSSSASGMPGRAQRVPFTLRSHPRGHNSNLVQCYILRDRSATHVNYELYLEEPNRKLIVAMKMNLNRTSNYHFFDMTRGIAVQDISKLSKKSGNYLGKLRSLNNLRTEYVLLTHNNAEREEVAGVYFETQRVVDLMTANSQPRKMIVALPHIDSRKLPIPNRVQENRYITSSSAGSNSLVDIIKHNQLTNRALKFVNKQPVFENGNFRLNFGGRVSKASVKNFQLVAADSEEMVDFDANTHTNPPERHTIKNDSDSIICQFGKVDNDRYALDYKAPLNAFQAFALAVCQFNL